MDERKLKVEELIKKFGDADRGVDFYAVAPGRVNIIGEHVDYCGYAVLPMAVQQNILIATQRNSNGKLEFCNTNSSFEQFSCSFETMNIDQTQPKWYYYAMCGIRGIIEHFELASPVGMTLAVDGNVPCNAGLSSSSALVCAAAYATLHANNLEMKKADLANLAAACEKYIGTQGGGMDQAISILAQKGKAKLIEFNPLRDTDVTIPSGAKFVIINSCVEINKASTSNYNERVVECRISSQILAKSGGLEWRRYKKLGDVQAALEVPLAKMGSRVEDVLKKESYTRAEICDILGISDDELINECLTANTTDMQSFKLYQRAKHVYEEASRVYEFKETCENPTEDCFSQLGKLMNASHDSLRDLYECSHPDVDQLVDICRKSGAFGSRITGAGWGGCTVSMVQDTKVKQFIEQVQKKFFEVNKNRAGRMDSAIFVSESASGAQIFN